MAHHLIAQIFDIFFFQSHAVVFLVLIPLFQLDHQVNGLGILYALHTKQCLGVDNSNSPEFDKMPCDIRRCPDQRLITDLLDLHHVVGHKTMSPMDQLQRHLTFSDTALAGDQHTLTINIHQHAVDADPGRQLHLQPAVQL